MTLFGWLVPRKDLTEIQNGIAELQLRLGGVYRLIGATYGKVVTMSGEIDALKAGQAKVAEAFGRLANEVREMAAKLGSVQDLSEVAAVAEQLDGMAAGIEALRAEVDTDNSNAPAPSDG